MTIKKKLPGGNLQAAFCFDKADYREGFPESGWTGIGNGMTGGTASMALS